MKSSFSCVALYATPLCAALKPSATWLGAGRPRPSLPAAELPPLLMQALQLNDFPEIDAGLHAMWAFAGDTTRFIYKNNETEFIEDAHMTADTLPTSFYGMAMHGREWEMETELTLVGSDLEAACGSPRKSCAPCPPTGECGDGSGNCEGTDARPTWVPGTMSR